jgi:hypothetical protein
MRGVKLPSFLLMAILLTVLHALEYQKITDGNPGHSGKMRGGGGRGDGGGLAGTFLES